MAVAATTAISAPTKHRSKRWQAGKRGFPMDKNSASPSKLLLRAAAGGRWSWLVFLPFGMAAYLWLLHRSMIIFHSTAHSVEDHGTPTKTFLVSLASQHARFVPLEVNEEHSRKNQESTFVLLEPANNNNNTASTLPTWLTDYFSWHQEQLQSLTAENWKSRRFLVSRCLTIDRACGGAADRLQSLPALLWLAAQSRRLFLFAWSRPAPMETYWRPTPNLNWTLPSFVPTHGRGTRLYTKLSTLVHAALPTERHSNTTTTTTTVPVMCARLQDAHSVAQYYNEHHAWNNAVLHHKGALEPYRRDFRMLVFAVLMPSPSVLRQYQKETRALFPSIQTTTLPSYTVAHIRANYGNSSIPKSQIRAVAQNAVHCARRLETNNNDDDGQPPPQHPILVISDSAAVIQTMMHYDGPPSFSHSVVTTHASRSHRPPEPLHLDKDVGAAADDYLDIFVDLLHLANARCVSHGIGGFGRFGVLLSRDPTCFFAYIDQGQYYECN